MQRGLAIFILLLVFCAKPEFLYPLDTVSGRLLMLTVIVYLSSSNLVLGLAAALAMLRVLDRESAIPTWRPVRDLMDIEALMQPKNSWSMPTLRTTSVPVNDIYEPYSVF